MRYGGMMFTNSWELQWFGVVLLWLSLSLSGCDLLFGDGNDELDDESPYNQTYTSDDFSWMQMPESDPIVDCMTDSECSGEETKTVCGSACGMSPRCMVPGSAGTACNSDFDCNAPEGESDSMYRCILGVCEHISLSSVRLDSEYTSLAPNVQTLNSQGQIQPEGQTCILYDQGDVFKIVTMTPDTTGSISSPGEGWWKIMIPIESLWDGNSLDVAPPEYQEAESFYFEDSMGLDVEIDTEFPAHYDFPDEYELFTAYAMYVTPDGKACLGSGGTIVVESFLSEYYGSRCGYASLMGDPEMGVTATLRF